MIIIYCSDLHLFPRGIALYRNNNISIHKIIILWKFPDLQISNVQTVACIITSHSCMMNDNEKWLSLVVNRTCNFEVYNYCCL